jgi:hypothetical protein
MPESTQGKPLAQQNTFDNNKTARSEIHLFSVSWIWNVVNLTGDHDGDEVAVGTIIADRPPAQIRTSAR